MVNGEPLLFLPLVHHLVEQCIGDFFPRLRPNEAPGDGNFRNAVRGGRRVMPQPGTHSARDDHRNVAQRAPESFGIQSPMFVAESFGPGAIIRVAAAHATGAVCRRYCKADEYLACKPPLNATSVDE